MRIIRALDEAGQACWGSEAADGQALYWTGCPWEGGQPTERPLHISERLPPVDHPLMLGIALNYRQHAAETGKAVPERPVFFVKLPQSLIAHGQTIRLPRHAGSTQVDYEGELAVVLGRPARDVSATDAAHYIYGYTLANDVSARDWQYQWGGGQFNRAKSFDTFCPLGPGIVPARDLPDPARLRLQTWLNGELVQDSPVSDLVFSIPALIAFLSQDTTLPAGTVILTGTPAGVGHGQQPPRYLQGGDVVKIAVEGMGELVNRVQA